MELQFFGANCIKIITKKQNVVVDDNLAELGGSKITKPQDILLSTDTTMPMLDSAFQVVMPGEYEIGGVSIHGISVSGYAGETGNKDSVLYSVAYLDTTVAVAGHMKPDLTDDQLESLGLVDILVLPVGNGGHTLDGAQALKLIKKIEPKVVIPTSYAEKGLKLPEDTMSLDDVIAGLGMEPLARVDKFRMKDHDVTGSTKLIILEKS